MMTSQSTIKRNINEDNHLYAATPLPTLDFFNGPRFVEKVDENMHRAHVRNAGTEGKFFFRTNIDHVPEPTRGRPAQIEEYRECEEDDEPPHLAAGKAEKRYLCSDDDETVLEEMSVLEILMGRVREAQRL